MDGDLRPICLSGATIAGLPVMLVLLTALFPGYVERARTAMRERPGRSFLLGLVNFAFFTALSSLAGAGFAPLALLGAFSLVILLPLFLLTGLLIGGGIAGERIWLQIASRPGSLIGSLVVGVVTLGLTLLVPLFGWLLFLGVAITGLGAAILALVRGRRAAEPPEPAE